MPNLIAAPAMLTAAAADAAWIGSAISAAHSAAAAQTTEVVAAPCDWVSTPISSPFPNYAQQFHPLFHTQFVALRRFSWRRVWVRMSIKWFAGWRFGG